MKKYILILTAVVLAVMSCSTDNIENGPSSLDIEIVPAWDITRGITSASQTVKLTVNLNVQTIHWQVSSDSEWCKVDSDLIHTGSDEVELVVESNDSFDKRNAVLTVTAGRYTRKVEIDQAGNVFVMSDVYKILGSNEALSYDVEVRTTSEWTIEAPDWIEAEKVGTPTVDEFGQTMTVMHVSIDANPGEQSRYGAVQLIPTEGYNGEFTVFQFGSEVNMTDDGKIAVAAEGNVSFEVTAPFGIIEKVEVPYWVQCTETPAEDGLNSVFEFWIGKNLSDTKAGRECVVEFTVKDSGRSIALPAITQDFVPAGGIAGSTECGISDSKNSGTLMINNGILLKNTSSRICFGGIAGRNVAGDLNTYSGCVNDGEVGISTKSNDFNILPAFTGGILGYTEMPVAVKGCENNGYVNSSGANNKYDGLFSAAGGIVGAIVETVAEVADCIVSVDIRNYAYNRNIDMDPFKMCHCGGIVGCAVGESQSNIVKISNCSNSGALENKRSTAAGIVGFAKYAAVSDCRFTGSVVGSGPHFAAGIAGCLSDASVTDCIVKSPDIYSHSSLGFNSINHFPAAGIVGYLYGKSSVSRCKAFATLIQNVGSTANEQMHVGMGLIAGISTAGSTISDCGVGGTLNTGSAGKVQNVIMTVTSDNFGNCIVGDGNVTPSGCYYWNGQE